MQKLCFTGKSFHKGFAWISVPAPHKHCTASPKAICLQFPTMWVDSWLTATHYMLCIFFGPQTVLFLKKCLYEFLQADTTHSVLLHWADSVLDRQSAKGVKVLTVINMITYLPERKFQASSGSASCGYKTFGWLEAWAEKTLQLSATDCGKRPLLSKLEIYYSRASRLLAENFWLGVICMFWPQNDTLSPFKRLKEKGKKKKLFWLF